MRIAILIFGLLFTGAGVGMTGYSWYDAASTSTIVDGLAFGGPVLLVVGIYRIIRAGIVMPYLFRFVAVGIGLAVGYANVSIQKTLFPSDRIVATTNTSNPL